MRVNYLPVVLIGLACCNGAVAQSSTVKADSETSALRLEADVRFLADDLLEGREAGTRGYDLAARYVAEAYRGIGLDPGGNDNTFFQQVPMREYRKDAEGAARLVMNKNGQSLSLTENKDYIVLPTPKGTSTTIEAPAVFAGFGLVSEEHGRNDFAELNVAGKIVFVLSGAPKFLNSEERAHHGSVKAKNASRNGAKGVVVVFTDRLQKIIPFKKFVEYWTHTSSMSWLDQSGQPFTQSPNVQAVAVVSLDGAERIFSASGRDFADIRAAAKSDAGEVPVFDLGFDARIEVDSLHRQLESPNVVGVLQGSDPELREECIILTAHLDHDGVRPSDNPDDDEIFNGAMDNAVGIAAMLEVARLLSLDPPRRTVVFVALAAEEKGLVGSDYFARNPTIPADSMVAVVNLDMPILTYDFTDVVAFGAERSTLYPVVEAAVKQHGLTLSPDPTPDEGLFTRSDHYSFVKQGVPAAYLSPGFANGGEQAQAAFRKEHYHQFSDQVEHVDFDALAKFAATKHSIARGIANMPVRPLWKSGDFFARTFDGPVEEAH